MADQSPLAPDVTDPHDLGVQVSVVIAPLPGTAGSSPLSATGGTVPVEAALVGLAVLLAGALLVVRARRRRGASGRDAAEGV